MANLGPPQILQLPVGYTVTTYQTETSTEKPTYSDVDLKIKNTNPITLDTLNEQHCYLETDVGYRFTIKDADGTTIHTVDDVYPIQDPKKRSGDLDLTSVDIISSSAADINVTPDRLGILILDGLTWPSIDGNANQILTTPGDGILTWLDNASAVDEDVTPQLGGNLDTNSFNILIDTGASLNDDSDNKQMSFVTTISAVNHIEITNSAIGVDPSISPAGDDANIDVILTPKGTGKVKTPILDLPNSDGAGDTWVSTDGSGTVGFSTFSHDPATQTEVENASGVRITPPSLVEYHPLLPIAWAYVSGSGTKTYGVSSITTTASAHKRIHFSKTMGSVNYVATVDGDVHQTGVAYAQYTVKDKTTGYVEINPVFPGGTDGSAAPSAWSSRFSVIVYGYPA